MKWQDMQIGRLEIFTSLTPIQSPVYVFYGICILLIVFYIINVMIFLDISPFFPHSFCLNSYLITAEKMENDTLLWNMMLFFQIAVCWGKEYFFSPVRNNSTYKDLNYASKFNIFQIDRILKHNYPHSEKCCKKINITHTLYFIKG